MTGIQTCALPISVLFHKHITSALSITHTQKENKKIRIVAILSSKEKRLYKRLFSSGNLFFHFHICKTVSAPAQRKKRCAKLPSIRKTRLFAKRRALPFRVRKSGVLQTLGSFPDANRLRRRRRRVRRWRHRTHLPPLWHNVLAAQSGRESSRAPRLLFPAPPFAIRKKESENALRPPSKKRHYQKRFRFFQ